jgi:hypothetical protein
VERHSKVRFPPKADSGGKVDTAAFSTFLRKHFGRSMPQSSNFRYETTNVRRFVSYARADEPHAERVAKTARELPEICLPGQLVGGLGSAKGRLTKQSHFSTC